jgi:hypothetical protein
MALVFPLVFLPQRTYLLIHLLVPLSLPIQLFPELLFSALYVCPELFILFSFQLACSQEISQCDYLVSLGSIFIKQIFFLVLDEIKLFLVKLLES